MEDLDDPSSYEGGGGEEGGGGGGEIVMDEDKGINNFLTFLPPYILCNFTNYTKLPLCNNGTNTLEENEAFEYALIVAIVVPITLSLTRPFCLPSLQENEAFEYALIVAIVVPIIFGIIVLVGFFGNTLVVIVIIANKTMRSTTNYLIFSLAMADLLFIVFCVPFTASDYILASWPFGNIWCKTVQYLTYVTAYASVYTLLMLSFDRFLAVVHPIAAISIRTENNAIHAIAFSWVLILTSCIPLYMCHGIKEQKFEGEVFFQCSFLDHDYNYSAFHIGFITTMYFLPLTVIVVLYLMILKRLWYGVGTRSAESVRGKKRVTRMVVIVVVTFIVCWFPIQLVLLLKSLGMYEMTTFHIITQIAAQVLAYINSCVNPILYAFLSDPFRKAFRKVISCGPQHRLVLNGQMNNMECRPLNPRPSPKPLPSSNLTITNANHMSFSPTHLNHTTSTMVTTSFTNGAPRDDASGNSASAEVPVLSSQRGSCTANYGGMNVGSHNPTSAEVPILSSQRGSITANYDGSHSPMLAEVPVLSSHRSPTTANYGGLNDGSHNSSRGKE